MRSAGPAPDEDPGDLDDPAGCGDPDGSGVPGGDPDAPGGAAVDLVSGPGGLASALRTGLLTARLAGPSLSLDVGYADTVPVGIRQAVLQRARGHCEWAGGCRQPAGACHIHHVTRKADGGKTSVTDCVLLCSFHHLVAVHRWGWKLILNPDGTTTACSPDGRKVLHSHGPPPPRPG
jgi:hypothetical protein